MLDLMGLLMVQWIKQVYLSCAFKVFHVTSMSIPPSFRVIFIGKIGEVDFEHIDKEYKSKPSIELLL